MYKYLKLGDIEVNKVEQALQPAFTTNNYQDFFISAFIQNYKYRYMCVNNEDISLNFISEKSKVISPILSKMIEAEINANPEYAQINIGISNSLIGNENTDSNGKIDTTNTQTTKDTIENTGLETVARDETDNDTGKTTVGLIGKEVTDGSLTTINSNKRTGNETLTHNTQQTTIDTSIKSDTNVRTGSETDSGTTSGTTNVSNTNTDTGKTTTLNDRTLDDTTKRTTSNESSQKQSGVKTTTTVPAAQIITKDISMNIEAPQSQSSFLSDIQFNSKEGEPPVWADSVNGSTPYEADETRISSASEVVHYSALAREPDGTYKQNKTTETYGIDGTPLSTVTNTNVTETVGKTGEHNISEITNTTVDTSNSGTSKSDTTTNGTNNNTRTYNSITDKRTVKGEDSESNNLEVSLTGTDKTDYNITVTDDGNQINNTTVDTNSNSTTDTTNNRTIDEDTKRNYSDTKISDGSLSGNLVTNNTNNVTRETNSNGKQNGFNMDRSELTDNFINLLKKDRIFEWFMKQYEGYFASSYNLDYREWWEL